jgi:hypothetical protein
MYFYLFDSIKSLSPSTMGYNMRPRRIHPRYGLFGRWNWTHLGSPRQTQAAAARPSRFVSHCSWRHVLILFFLYSVQLTRQQLESRVAAVSRVAEATQSVAQTFTAAEDALIRRGRLGASISHMIHFIY